MSASWAPESPQPDRSRLYRSALVLFVAVLVVLSAVVGYWYLRNRPIPDISPHAVATLGSGTRWMDLPLWSWHFAPPLFLKGFVTSFNLSYSTAHGGLTTWISYRWGNVTGASEPVHFVLEHAANQSGGTTRIMPGGEDAFDYLPAGRCENRCTYLGLRESTWGPHPVEAVEYTKVQMNYTVYRMAETRDSVERTWLQVNYTIQPFGTYGGDPLPRANVSAPGMGDLTPVTPPTTYTFPMDSAWSLNFSARSFASPGLAFRNTLPPLHLSAGAAGELDATLASEFRWDASSDSWLGLSAEEGTTLTFQLFLDMRFGTLVIRYLT